MKLVIPDHVNGKTMSSVRRLQEGVLPFAAPSTGVFDGISPQGAMQGCIALTEGQEAPSGNLVQKRGAQDQSGIRAAFSLGYFSLGEAQIRLERI